MLRLWPEAISVGLFSGHCWLRRGALETRSESGMDFAGQLETVRELLAVQTRRFGRFARADVVVSDSHARVALVPWQDSLHSEAQVNAYGRAILESMGFIADEGWCAHTGFRHYGAPGFTSALPASLVDQLRAECSKAGVVLRSVLPVSAAVYWYHRPALKKGESVLLINEPGRLTAVVHQSGRLSALDIEPIVGTVEQAATRLEARIQMRCPAIRQVEVCSQPLAAWNESRLSQLFAQAQIRKLPRACWSFA
ncbi:hypothetical protein [Pseudoduganella sp.]|uniref:hypothetical protein n=1 Tax=Pseudoduganella sp. TaxID=1880898 RepID=UPI0035AF2044